MPAVVWPDGSVQAARSWRGLLAEVNRLPWNQHLKEVEFREEMARRAYVWCGEPVVHPQATPKRFFEQLEQAKMLRILADRDEPWPWIKKQPFKPPVAPH